jgi:hypothetical protein
MWAKADLHGVGEDVRHARREDDTGSGHHAAQRVPDLPYLARQLSGGETWQIRKGATQEVVGWLMGGSGPKSVSGSSWIELGTLREWQGHGGFRLVLASGE